MKVNNNYIENFIKSHMAILENNNLKELPGFAFAEPIVGFSKGIFPPRAFESNSNHFFHILGLFFRFCA